MELPFDLTDGELDQVCEDVVRESGICPVLAFFPERYEEHRIRKQRTISARLRAEPPN